MNLKKLGSRCLLAGALTFLGCGPPKYVGYASKHGDWKASVPWGWNVMTDEEEGHFKNTTLIGPFEPEFYLGAPSFSVRWHAYGKSHRLRDGLVESYANADDYIAQMLANVYSPEYQLVAGEDYHRLRPVSEVFVSPPSASGRKAKHFVVLSPVPVPAGTKWGTSVDPESGRLANVRLHAYTVVPLEKGFYVIVYPATRDAYALYEKQYSHFVNTFTLLKDGPDGPALAGAARPAKKTL